jgi:hypothetical protein
VYIAEQFQNRIVTLSDRINTEIFKYVEIAQIEISSFFVSLFIENMRQLFEEGKRNNARTVVSAVLRMG